MVFSDFSGSHRVGWNVPFCRVKLVIVIRVRMDCSILLNNNFRGQDGLFHFVKK